MWARLFSLCVLFMGCASLAAPREGSVEWVVQHYAEALLLSDAEAMRKYLARGLEVEEAPRNPDAAAMHIIRLCPQGGSEERKSFIVLFGGRLENTVNGMDVVAIREEGSWRIRDARLSVGADGAPRAYLRNCNIDPRLTKGG